MSFEAFDIVVIGAGIAGASVAADLARTHRVAILEREDFPGYHSTGRSAALFSEIYGNDVVRALSRASRAFFYEPPSDFASVPLVRPRGSLYVARSEQLDRLKAFITNDDVAAAVRRLSPQDALRACPILRSEYVSAALLEPNAADVDVDALHQGYLRRFKSAGGTLITNTDVRGMTHASGHWRILTRDRSYGAPIVVNAAGAWADQVALVSEGNVTNLQPLRRTVAIIELPAGVSPGAWPMVIDIDETFYMKPEAGLLLISPADESPVAACDVQPEELDVALAVDRIERATTLKIGRIRKRWAGLRTFAPDRSPVVGFDAQRPGFFWLAGHGGYGIQTAPALAEFAAALVRGEPPAPDLAGLTKLLSPRRFDALAVAASAI